MERVLIVDDDPDILRLISYNLSQAGWRAVTATTGREALRSLREARPDLVILDLMLPDIDGYEVCRTIRREQGLQDIPVIILTARGEEIDRVQGFEIGADDYVTKPFSPKELVLRVRSVLRRQTGRRADTLRVGRIRIERGRRECFVGEHRLTLTPKEYDLLLELAAAGGNVVTRAELLQGIWGYSGDSVSRTLDTHIRRLREKLGAESGRIRTVRGIGFRLDIEEDRPQ